MEPDPLLTVFSLVELNRGSVKEKKTEVNTGNRIDTGNSMQMNGDNRIRTITDRRLMEHQKA